MEIEERIIRLAGNMERERAELVTLIDQFDRDRLHLRYGQQSTAKWLQWRCEIAPSTARDLVRVARALRHLPAIAAALEDVPFCRVRAITRAATPDDEQQWLQAARTLPVRELEQLVSRARSQQIRIDPAQQQAERMLRSRRREDGMTEIRMLIPTVDAELYMKAIRVAGQDLVLEEDENHGTPLADRRRADAALTLARSYLQGSSQTRVSQSRALLLVNIDAASREARIGDGPVLPAPSFDEVGCDAMIALVERKDDGSIKVSRARNTIPPRLRREILLRDPCCQYPGCRNNAFLHLHHKTPGVHTAEAIIPLCSFHHRFTHHNDITYTRDSAGRVTAAFPGGRVVTEVMPAA